MPSEPTGDRSGYALYRAIRDAKLPRSEKAVLFVLATYAGTDWRCWPSIATLALGTSMSAPAVRRVLRRLERLGVLSTERGGGTGRSSRYRIDLHAIERESRARVETDSPTAKPDDEPQREPDVRVDDASKPKRESAVRVPAPIPTPKQRTRTRDSGSSRADGQTRTGDATNANPRAQKPESAVRGTTQELPKEGEEGKRDRESEQGPTSISASAPLPPPPEPAGEPGNRPNVPSPSEAAPPPPSHPAQTARPTAAQARMDELRASRVRRGSAGTPIGASIGMAVNGALDPGLAARIAQRERDRGRAAFDKALGIDRTPRRRGGAS